MFLVKILESASNTELENKIEEFIEDANLDKGEFKITWLSTSGSQSTYPTVIGIIEYWG